MGCCGSSEKLDSIKKDKQQLKSEYSNNVINDEKPSSPSAKIRNKVQPLEEDNTPSLIDSKLIIYL